MIELLLFVILLPATAHDYVASGNAAYHARRYDEAIRAYRGALALSPNAAGASFDLGDGLYRRRDYTAADEAWDRAARLSRDSLFQARCRYNQGNASYKRAAELSTGNIEPAIAALERAAKAYSMALELDPQLMPARYNLDAAREFIRRLRARTNPGPDPNEVLRLDSAVRPSGRQRTADKDW